MSEYNVKLDIEPTNRYENARKAMISALQATSLLSPQEKMQLCHELMGTEAFISLMNMLGFNIQ